MASKVQEIALKPEQLGKNIKATFKSERNIYVGGKEVKGRVFVASSSKQPDFEVVVPNLRNSQMFNGRQEVRLVEPMARVVPKRNNIGNTRSMNMVVYAKRLEVVGGNK
ncbi:TPA: hypothetical protein ITS99_002302 [Enterococcus faecalis]|nr:hypothetical protein [Enterococcus faecalis]